MAILYILVGAKYFLDFFVNILFGDYPSLTPGIITLVAFIVGISQNKALLFLPFPIEVFATLIKHQDEELLGMLMAVVFPILFGALTVGVLDFFDVGGVFDDGAESGIAELSEPSGDLDSPEAASAAAENSRMPLAEGAEGKAVMIDDQEVVTGFDGTSLKITGVEAPGTEHVDGHFRNGTWVEPYIRTEPDSTRLNNFTNSYYFDSSTTSAHRRAANQYLGIE